MTKWFLEHTLADQGFVRLVEPKVVLEVAFNAVMRSDRHESGFALRFLRILRLRDDKSPDEIDTLETVKEIFERQKRSQSARGKLVAGGAPPVRFLQGWDLHSVMFVSRCGQQRGAALDL